MPWVLLLVAGLFEVLWALALKESNGFSRALPTAVFAPTYIASAVLLGIALKDLPVGTGYAVWVGIGAVGAVLFGIAVFGESVSPGRLIPLGMIAIGVIWLAFSETASG